MLEKFIKYYLNLTLIIVTIFCFDAHAVTDIAFYDNYVAINLDYIWILVGIIVTMIICLIAFPEWRNWFVGIILAIIIIYASFHATVDMFKLLKP